MVAIVSVLAAVAAPSFQDMIQYNRLKQVAESLKSDLQWMRTETIKQGCNLQASFTNGAVWSYQIYIPPALANTPCAVQQFYHGCTIDFILEATANCNIKTVNSTQFTGITMGAVSFFSAPTTVAEFNFRRGEAKRSNNNDASGIVELNSSNYTVKIDVASVGRVKVCNIAGSNGLIGYENC